MAPRTWTNGSGTALSAANLNALEADVAAKADANHTHAAATTSAAGFMSTLDKVRLDGLGFNGANIMPADLNYTASGWTPDTAIVPEGQSVSYSTTVNRYLAGTATTYVPIDANKFYRYSFELYSNNAGQVTYIDMNWKNSSKASITVTPRILTNYVIPTATWTPVSGYIGPGMDVVPPANSAFIVPFIYANHANGTQGGTLWVADFRIVDVTDVVDIVRNSKWLASSTLHGNMSAADKAKLDAATTAPTNATLMLRDGSGGSQLNNLFLYNQPSSTGHATRKDYVDSGLGQKQDKNVPAMPNAQDLNAITTTVNYNVQSSSQYTGGLNYPIRTGGTSAAAGMFSSMFRSTGDSGVQRYRFYTDGEVVERHYYGGTWSPWVTLSNPEVNVKNYGAKGDGTTDDFAAISAALAAVPAGGVLYFPPGTYYTTYKDPTVTANWLTVDKSGVTFTGNPGSVILENFLIYLKGTYGSLLNNAANLTIGDQTMTTTTAHPFVVGDYVQLISGINAYTPDGGEWTLGSSSPTDSSQPIARYSEIHRVEKVNSTTSVTFHENVVYPGYNINTTGQSFPITGVTRAQFRELNVLKDITFYGIKFKNITGDNARGIVARACVNLTFDYCAWETGVLAGSGVKATDCYNTNFINCSSQKNLDSATWSGSSWNTFMIGGGCHGTTFDNCTFVGEAQTIDFTPNNFNTGSDIGGAFDSAGSWLTNQFMKVVNCTFRNCSDATTSHPGTYSFEFDNNVVDGGSTGIRARSKSSVITNNTVFTSRVGVALSSYISDSVVKDNTFIQRASVNYANYYVGVSYAATSSEIMSDNSCKNVVIGENEIRVSTAYSVNAGISLFHVTPAAYTPWNDDIKNNLSDILVRGNSLRGCSIVVDEFINGTRIVENHFVGGSDRTHYILCQDNSAANHIQRNHFMDSIVAHIRTGAVTLTGHGYNTTHKIGLQSSSVPLSNTLANTDVSYVYAAGTLFDSISVPNNGVISSLRSSGTAAIKLDAIAADGTSGVFVDVFNGNTTTGSKQLRVYGETRSESYRIGTSSGPTFTAGAVAPEGAVTAPVGSLYVNTAGGAATTLYVKTSGTGNTGWTAK